MAFPSENRRITLAEHTADQVIRAGRPFQVVSPPTPRPETSRRRSPG